MHLIVAFLYAIVFDMSVAFPGWGVMFRTSDVFDKRSLSPILDSGGAHDSNFAIDAFRGLNYTRACTDY